MQTQFEREEYIQVEAVLIGDQIHSQTKVSKPSRSTNL